MAGHVVDGNLVRDPLKAEKVDQPVEQRRSVVPFNGGTQSLIIKVLDQIESASEAANLVDKMNGVIKGSSLGNGWLGCGSKFA
jgi:hypothetical protein